MNSSPTKSSINCQLPHWWNIPKNPIFIRYCRSQLRPAKLTIAVIAILLLTLFIFLGTFLGGTRLAQLDTVSAARSAFLPLFTIQYFLLLLTGTHHATERYVQDSLDRTTEYQRLTPMSPLSKVMGYLFGTTIRVYFLLAVTLPFTLFCVIAGKINIVLVIQLYTILFLSGILYHLIGIVTGTIVKKKVFALLLAGVLNAILNIILPSITYALGKGYAFITHINIGPVASEKFANLLEDSLENVPFAIKNAFSDGVQFYGLTLSNFCFSLIIQCLGILLLVTILYRRWKDANHHLLGKHFAVASIIVLSILFFGNVIPTIENGSIFPSKVLNNTYTKGLQLAGKTAGIEETIGLIGFSGAFTYFIACAVVFVISPIKNTILQGLRKSKKLGTNSITFQSDASTSVFHSLLISSMLSIMWWVFAFLITKKWHPTNPITLVHFPIFFLSFTVSVMTFWGFMEGRKNNGVFWLFAIFFWILPLMVSGILLIMEWTNFAILSLAPSSLVGFFSLAKIHLIPSKESMLSYSCYLWVAIHLVLFLFMLLKRVKLYKELSQQVTLEIPQN